MTASYPRMINNPSPVDRGITPDVQIGSPANEHWRHGQIARWGFVAPLIEQSYMKIARHYGYIKANMALHDLERLARRGDLWLKMSDGELVDWCNSKAKAMASMLARRKHSPIVAQRLATQTLARYSLEYPIDRSYSDRCNPFKVANAKLSCPRWWRRQIRRLQARTLDDFGRARNLVCKGGQIYLTDYAANWHTQRRAHTDALLAKLEARNDVGDSYTLAELTALSVANPAIQRTELMARLAGFEEYARRLNRVAEFYTITCPSRFHPTHIGGKPNTNYTGASVRDCHKYLMNLWSRIRAAADRRGLKYFGFRVAEPHHNGTPHWHFLLFVDSEQASPLRRLIRKYALADSPDEIGAQKYRFRHELIDPTKGSAACYLAKYIAKGTDGHGLAQDLYKERANRSAARIRAWASIHGIRQFQQIGGPSVTVWRELRRLEEQPAGLIEQARVAADAGNWADFCELMGSGRDQPIKIARWHEIDPQTGELLDPPTTHYGAPNPGRVFGVRCGIETVLTRFYRWSISLIDGGGDRQSITFDEWKLPPMPGFISDWVGGLGGAPPPLEYCQ